MSVLPAQLVGSQGTVLAVEPDPVNLSLPRANIRRHRLYNVRVVAAAASRTVGYLGLRDGEPGNAGAYEAHGDLSEDDLVVPAVAIDDLLNGQAVDVVKVDVQGADHDVIAGMRKTLDRSPRATVLVKFWLDGMHARGVDPRAVLQQYRALGRPLALLDDAGRPSRADDEAILAACEAWSGHFVNLVLSHTK
jgi:FkbM family methyltransferase